VLYKDESLHQMLKCFLKRQPLPEQLDWWRWSQTALGTDNSTSVNCLLINADFCRRVLCWANLKGMEEPVGGCSWVWGRAICIWSAALPAASISHVGQWIWMRIS
jgi:hypothetical protein